MQAAPYDTFSIVGPIPEVRYPPLNLSPQRQRQKTLESIVAILLELAEQQPVLFILEDLHFTDPSTLELLDLLIDQTPTASVCVLLTCRPTFRGNRTIGANSPGFIVTFSTNCTSTPNLTDTHIVEEYEQKW